MGEELTYAIGDVHGRLDLLMDLLSQVITHASGRSCKLVFLGDYIDRGPDSAEVVALVRRFQQGTVNSAPKRQSCRGRNRHARTRQPMRATPVASRQVRKARSRAARYSLAERR
jgi:Calcineurin-like phosphoesterase